MRRASTFATVVLSFAFAAGAQAAAVPVTGTLAFQIATLAPIAISGSGTAIVNGSSGLGHLTSLAMPTGAFATAGLFVPVTDPGASPIKGILVTAANGAGSFAGSGGSGFGGVLPLVGSVKVCLFGPCSAAVGNLDVPLSVVGQGGAAFTTGAVNFTVVGAPWTTGTVSIGALTAMGGVSPASATDTVSLVSPIFISTNLGVDAIVPAFAFLTLTGIPEPGTALLFGVGFAALVAVGRHRTRV